MPATQRRLTPFWLNCLIKLMKKLQTILLVLFFCAMLMAEAVASASADSLVADTSATVTVADTTAASAAAIDTSASMAVTDRLPDPDQVAIDSGEQKKEKTKLIKRTFDSRQQVSLGVGMMVFIALIMTTAQSWNPKN